MASSAGKGLSITACTDNTRDDRDRRRAGPAAALALQTHCDLLRDGFTAILTSATHVRKGRKIGSRESDAGLLSECYGHFSIRNVFYLLRHVSCAQQGRGLHPSTKKDEAKLLITFCFPCPYPISQSTVLYSIAFFASKAEVLLSKEKG